MDSSSTNSPPRVCELLDLPPVAGGYGLLHVINDEDGRRCTAFTTDLAWHQSWVISGRPSETTNIDGVRRPSRIWEQVPSPEEFAEHYQILRAGWPDDWL